MIMEPRIARFSTNKTNLNYITDTISSDVERRNLKFC